MPPHRWIRLPSVWHTITAATVTAAESFTLAALAAERGPAVADDQTANS
jgi:hypothetical protein